MTGHLTHKIEPQMNGMNVDGSGETRRLSNASPALDPTLTPPFINLPHHTAFRLLRKYQSAPATSAHPARIAVMEDGLRIWVITDAGSVTEVAFLWPAEIGRAHV